MHGSQSNVLPRVSLMTESLLKALVSEAVRQVQLRGGHTDRDLGDLISCDPGTVANARNMDSKMQAHTLFNLLCVDDMALEGLLHHYGRRSVPIAAKCDTDALVSTSAAVHKLAVAQSPASEGGYTLTDNECLETEPEIDAAMAALCNLKSRCHEIRKERATA